MELWGLIARPGNSNPGKLAPALQGRGREGSWLALRSKYPNSVA